MNGIFLKGLKFKRFGFRRLKALGGALLLFFVFFTAGCHKTLFESEEKEERGEQLLKGRGHLLLCFDKAVGSTTSAAAENPLLADTNSFVLTVAKSDGDTIYSGSYGGRPSPLSLDEGSYQLSISSTIFTTPQFEMACYSDQVTIVIKEDEEIKVPLLCRLSNAALKLKFTPTFKSRFHGYTTYIEDKEGGKAYSFDEERFLYLNPGQLLIKMKGASDNFLIDQRLITAGELLTLTLHSTSDGPPPDGEEGGHLVTGISIDTTAHWVSEEIFVGERRDGTSKKLALQIGELVSFIGHKEVWVEGYIVGTLTTGSLINEAPFTVETNIALGPFATTEERALCAGITLPKGAIREALNLKDNPELLGGKVLLKGTVVEAYYGLVGVNSVSDFELLEE